MSYNISDYGRMIADQVRMKHYVEALRRSVKPGDLVIDLGAGTGIFALLACRFGARRVYAIEPGDAIHVAREIAASNGLADRIEFIQDYSTKVTLPEKAQVIVSDLRGILPLFSHHLKALADARERLLADGGVLIPQSDTLWAAVVTAQDLYNSYAGPWDEHNHGFDMRTARRATINLWGGARIEPEQLLVEPREWARVEYSAIDQTNARSRLEWTVEEAAEAHGMAVWFDTTLCDGVAFSNAPGQGASVYGKAFFPWIAPVKLSPEDRIVVEIKADLVDDDYVWSWKTEVFDRGSPESAKANFNQSTFFSSVQSPAQLRKQSDDFIPTLNEDGAVDQFVLGLMNGEWRQGEIAGRLLERFPDRFRSRRDALTHVAGLSKRYSR
jgi:protein arginine N-methyltransferase 1